MSKILVTGKEQRVIGMHICAPNAGEIIQGYAVAFLKVFDQRWVVIVWSYVAKFTSQDFYYSSLILRMLPLFFCPICAMTHRGCITRTLWTLLESIQPQRKSSLQWRFPNSISRYKLQPTRKSPYNASCTLTLKQTFSWLVQIGGREHWKIGLLRVEDDAA